VSIELHYGQQRVLQCACRDDQVQAHLPLPRAAADFAAELARALKTPLDFPPLSKCVVPGDQVVLAVDRGVPRAAEVVAAVWEILEPQGIEPDSVTILQPASMGNGMQIDPRTALPAQVQSRMEWEIHDPSDESQQAYLATTAGGERIYLSRRLVEADFVLSIGEMSYDPVLGYRGTNSVFYPGLSSIDAYVRARGQGHSELGPDDERPFRQLIDEVAWLLGTQFTIQVVSAGRNDALAVISGAIDSVFRRGKELLAEHWRLQVDQRADVVVAAVESDAVGHGWDQIGAAVANARRLVANGGKIVLLSEIAAEPGDGIQLICDSLSPRDALQPLRAMSPSDLVPALQLADAIDWSDVYLLSGLRESLVEDLHMTPLTDEQQVDRLISDAETCIFVNGAQHAYGSVRS